MGSRMLTIHFLKRRTSGLQQVTLDVLKSGIPGVLLSFLFLFLYVFFLWDGKNAI